MSTDLSQLPSGQIIGLSSAADGSVAADLCCGRISASVLGVALSTALTNPALKVDQSTVSAVTGLAITSHVAGGGVTLAPVGGNTSENLILSGQGTAGRVLVPAGQNASNPGVGFSTELGTGFFLRSVGGYVGVAQQGGEYFEFSSNGFVLDGTRSLGWVAANSVGAVNPDTVVLRSAAGVLSQQNGTNAQESRVYNTFTDVNNGEWGAMRWSANQLQIGTYNNGTGTLRAVVIPATTSVAPFIIRNSGGVAGTNEEQIYHDGTNLILSNQVPSGGLKIYNAVANVLIRPDNRIGLPVGVNITWSSNTDGSGYDTSIVRIAPSVLCVTNLGLVTNGWMQSPAGRARNTADVTNSTTTFANLTDCTLPNMIAGRKYAAGRFRFKANNGTAVSGLKIDFAGGSATWTSFEYSVQQIAGTPATKGSDIAASPTTVLNYTAMGDTGDAVFEVTWSGVCLLGGTLIPRFANNSGVGTLTIRQGASMFVEDSPN